MLIVVMALLGTLTFLGFLFYTFSAQEHANAEYFAYAQTPTAEFPNSLFEDWFLEQLLLGTRPLLEDSALYGSNWALIPNMIGRPISPVGADQLVLADGAGNSADVNPFDGLGIGVFANATNPGTLAAGEFFFDYDGDGAPDANKDGAGGLLPIVLNYSRAANPGANPWSPPIEATAFHPDAGYTYPDVNSLFLAFDGYVRDPNNPTNVYRVIIPSFHRPQYLPDMRGINAASANGFESVFEPNVLGTRNKVLRPHYEHVNADDASVQRFIVPDLPGISPHPNPFWDPAANGVRAQSGDTTRIIPPFPFTVDINGDGVANQAGVWSLPVANTTLAEANDPSRNVYEFDVDCDGDGMRDSIWIDLDAPIFNLPDGRQFVPLFACKVIDADALLNVNAHGNMNGILARQWDGDVISVGNITTGFASASNLGLSRSEVNLGLGLTANPDETANPRELEDDDTANNPDPNDVEEREAAQLQQSLNFNGGMSFGGPLTQQELSNTELLMLLTGREQYRDSGPPGSPNYILDSRIEGRWGDDFRIPDLYAWLRAGAALGSFPGAPSPGGYLVDDDGDSNMVGYSPVFGVANPSGIIVPTLPAGFNSDDDLNAPVGHPRGGSAYRDPQLGNVWVPPFVHPLDYGGTGSAYLQNTGSLISRVFKGADADLSLTNNPLQWLSYAGSPWQYQFVSTDAFVGTQPLFGVAPYWGAVTNGALQLNAPQHDFLQDDGNEVILSRRFRNPEYDAVFPTHEMEGLHLSAQDYENVGGTSRLRELAIANFDKMNDDVGRLIRSRFTTDSWDRLDFAHGQSLAGTASHDWEFTLWNGSTTDFQTTTGNVAFPPEFSAAAAGSQNDPFRPELRLLLKSEFGYNEHLNTNGTSPRYPRHRLNINRVLSDESFVDPALAAFDANENPRFRNLTPHPDLRALEQINTGSTMPTITIPAMDHRNLPLGTAPNGPPFADLSIDPTGAGVTDAQRAQLATAMEWWARYDRQRLARDIYVMLWVLGGGQDGLNYTTGSVATLYTPEQVKEMAQTAVNIVDAMDRDNVITHFAYDKDLTNGWATVAGDPDLLEVDGVEAQQLTFSEALWIREPEVNTGSGSANDHNATLYDDSVSDHHYLFIELRNSSPFPVEFNNDAWRIRVDGLPSSTILGNTISPQRGNLAVPMTVAAGENFLIGTHDGESHVTGGVNDGKTRSSTFRVDHDSDFTYEAIVPYKDDPNAPTGTSVSEARDDYPDPLVDLDLCHERDRLTQRFAEYNSTPGYFIDAATFADAEMVLVLERRHTLHSDGLIDFTSDDWGEWLEVDRITVDRRDFNLRHDSSTTDIYNTTDGDGLLRDLLSQERPEPFYADNTLFNSLSEAKGLLDYAGANKLYRHTLGGPTPTHADANPTTQPPADVTRNHQKNSHALASGGSVFTLWQPHFDRDFSSVYELLSVPLYGPAELIYRDRQSGATLKAGLSQINTFKLSDRETAGIRFRNPFADLDRDGTRDEDANGDGTPDVKDDNRWYRLLELFTTEESNEQPIQDRETLHVRTPGRVNINTIRHESALAALIDDPHIQRFVSLPFLTTDAFDNTAGAVRNWFNELILARDGIDPLNALNGGPALPLPGIPGVPSDPSATPATVQYGAVPYRSLSYVAPDMGAIWPTFANLDKSTHTLLRHHVANDATTLGARPLTLDQLGLFEARPTTDIGTDAVDFHTRNRLLAKLANQTTNRSNVFAVWLTVGFFEAHQPDPLNTQVVQIGGEMAGMKRHRAFFIIDRTRLEEAVEVDDRGTTVGPNATDDDIITLNWRSFLLHRRSLPAK